jgi:hypothetical protein
LINQGLNSSGVGTQHSSRQSNVLIPAVHQCAQGIVMVNMSRSSMSLAKQFHYLCDHVHAPFKRLLFAFLMPEAAEQMKDVNKSTEVTTESANFVVSNANFDKDIIDKSAGQKSSNNLSTIGYASCQVQSEKWMLQRFSADVINQVKSGKYSDQHTKNQVSQFLESSKPLLSRICKNFIKF